MRIVRVANFVTERSGGLRTALRQLGVGYQQAGHEAVLIIPGKQASDVETEQGRIITLAGPEVPGMGGYRVLLDRNRTAAVLRKLRPDRIEVSDRTTLRWVGRWARRHGVPSMMVSHESLDGLLRLFGPSTGRWVAERIGARNVTRVPLGVDLDGFAPSRYDASLRGRWAAPGDVLLLHCGRLSAEKKPRRSLAA